VNGATHAFSCDANGPDCFLGSSSGAAFGWTAGGGGEYAVWDNVSLKAEYLYVNLGSAKNVDVVAVNGEGFIPSSFTAGYSRVDFHVVRFGLNYKFSN
jgi:outer membrane immunogenic protein